jgi:hypothetical protein
MGRYNVLLQEDVAHKTGSVLRHPPKSHPRAPDEATSTGAAEQLILRTSTQLNSVVEPEVGSSRVGKRPLARRTFDLYADQVTYLTRASLEERLAGRDVSMNAMVREAVEDYIAKRQASADTTLRHSYTHTL